MSGAGHTQSHRPSDRGEVRTSTHTTLPQVLLPTLDLMSLPPLLSSFRYHAVTRPAPSTEVQERLWTRPEDSRESVTLKLSQYQESVEALQVDTHTQPSSIKPACIFHHIIVSLTSMVPNFLFRLPPSLQVVPTMES